MDRDNLGLLLVMVESGDFHAFCLCTINSTQHSKDFLMILITLLHCMDAFMLTFHFLAVTFWRILFLRVCYCDN